MKRPNILFLMTDEHRADVAGFAGNTIIRTPNLDALAKTGVIFENAYTPSPICIPGRQCMMAGKFPKNCDCECFGDDLAPGTMTFPRLLSQYAYETVVCGKLHHIGTDPLMGFNMMIGNQAILNERYIKDKREEEFQKYKSCKFKKWSQPKEVKKAGIGQSYYTQSDFYSLEGALLFIENYFADPYYDRATPDRPLLLKLSLNQPHYPYLAAADKFTYYLNRVYPYLDEPIFPHEFLSRYTANESQEVTPRDIRRATAAYYGMVETCDDIFGQMMRALEKVGQNLDDWIIIYTSDHGEMLGQHGVWEKQKFFEASARVPLFIRWPQKFEHRIVRENVNLCDLFATICDLCEIPVPDGLDSRSMVGLMNGSETNWDNETVSQFGGTNLMIKQDALKYQYYALDQTEVLFDLEMDPSENQNFMDNPRYADKLAHFRRRKAELGF